MKVQSEEKQQILLIGNDEDNCDFFKNALNDNYVVNYCGDCKKILQQIQKIKPNLILLEVGQKDVTWLDTANYIKNDSESRDIPIIYISNQQHHEIDTDEHEIGVTEFICKPFSIEEIQHKISLVIEFSRKVSEQNKVIDETRQIAFSAMSQSGEIGQVIHFIRDSFECADSESLCKRLLEYCNDAGLTVSFRINTQPATYYSHQENVAKIDIEILDRLHALERIIDFGKRSLYNFNNLSLLIKNMPLEEDPDRYGRIKDNICLVLEAADARISSINSAIILKQRENAMSNLIETSRLTLRDVEKAFLTNAKKNADIMANLKEKIEWSFVQLGLSEEQEEEISKLVASADFESNALYDAGLEIEDRLNQINARFNTMSK